MDIAAHKKLEDFFFRYKILHYQKKETILFQNDIPEGVCFITKGYVRSYILTKTGKTLTINLLKRYHIFPMQWALNNTSLYTYYQALTDVDIIRVSKEEFVSFLRKHNDVLFFYMTKTLKRLSEASQRLAVSLYGTAYEKVGNILVFLAENLGVTQGTKTIIPVIFTHQEIADMIGLSRETTSLELEKLQEQRFISFTDHVISLHRMDELKGTLSLT